jgi:hypothetical protein
LLAEPCVADAAATPRASPFLTFPPHCLQGVDADTVVFVADPNTGNILNFNVGENVDILVPRVSYR